MSGCDDWKGITTRSHMGYQSIENNKAAYDELLVTTALDPGTISQPELQSQLDCLRCLPMTRDVRGKALQSMLRFELSIIYE